MATLATQTPAASTAIIVPQTWSDYDPFSVITTGDVTTVSIRLSAIGSTATGNIEVRLRRGGVTISTGSKSISTIPDIPVGSPDGIAYAINMTGVRINALDSLVLGVQRTAPTDAIWIHGTSAPKEAHTIVGGTLYAFAPPVSSGLNNMKTIRRLVSAANNKIWIEGV